MKTLYLTIKPEILTTVKLEKPQFIRKMKINKVVLNLNYQNITEKTHVKTATDRRDFAPGFLRFKELQRKFKELSIDFSIEEFSQKAVIKTPSSSAITLSDNLRDILGLDTKTFQQGTTTTLANPCDILNGLKYYTIKCNKINREVNLQGKSNAFAVGTNILGLLNIKSFNFVGGTQYHDADVFCIKELISTAFFNSLSFNVLGNNGEAVGEAFVELLLQ